MNSMEKQLLKACKEAKDSTDVLVYHDWLLDNGRVLDALAVSLMISNPQVTSISGLIGRVLCAAESTEDELILTLVTGHKCIFYNDESGYGNDVTVTIDDIVGDLDDLVGSPLTMAEEVSGNGDNFDTSSKSDEDTSFTWTFYKFATIKGYVTIKWYGTSNGYYSETCDFKVENP